MNYPPSRRLPIILSPSSVCAVDLEARTGANQDTHNTAGRVASEGPSERVRSGSQQPAHRPPNRSLRTEETGLLLTSTAYNCVRDGARTALAGETSKLGGSAGRGTVAADGGWRPQRSSRNASDLDIWSRFSVVVSR